MFSPQPSACTSVAPPRWVKPLKLNWKSVGVLAFMPRIWHIAARWGGREEEGGDLLVRRCELQLLAGRF